MEYVFTTQKRSLCKEPISPRGLRLQAEESKSRRGGSRPLDSTRPGGCACALEISKFSPRPSTQPTTPIPHPTPRTHGLFRRGQTLAATAAGRVALRPTLWRRPHPQRRRRRPRPGFLLRHHVLRPRVVSVAPALAVETRLQRRRYYLYRPPSRVLNSQMPCEARARPIPCFRGGRFPRWLSVEPSRRRSDSRISECRIVN